MVKMSQRPIELPSDLLENKTFVMGVNRDRLIKEIPGEPAFVDTEEYKIFGLDPKQASEMGIIDDSVIGDGEVILNNRFADSNGWKIGDTLELHDRAGEKHSFTVKNVITDNANNPCEACPVIMNGKIETTKENKTEHGFGLMNIESAAAVYGGEVSVSCDPESYGGSFTIEVMLPVTHQTEAHHRPR